MLPVLNCTALRTASLRIRERDAARITRPHALALRASPVNGRTCSQCRRAIAHVITTDQHRLLMSRVPRGPHGLFLYLLVVSAAGPTRDWQPRRNMGGYIPDSQPPLALSSYTSSKRQGCG